MNERIKYLAKQSGLSYLYDYDADGHAMVCSEADVKKFAELIVRECMSLCEDVKFQHRQYRMEETDFSMKNIYAEGEATCGALQHKMKKHFGVEE